MKNKWIVSIIAIVSLTVIAGLSIIYGADWQVIVGIVGAISSLAGGTAALNWSYKRTKRGK